MATKSLADLQAQIEKLQAEANKLRDEERAGVVTRIREAISTYDLTAQDLFGNASRSGAAGRGRSKPNGRRVPAYGDGAGNVWGGRGPRPKWLRDALAQGKQLEDFAVGKGKTSGTASALASESDDEAPTMSKLGKQALTTSKSARGGKNRRPRPAVKYRDESGNAWSGRGPQPKWFKEALAAGTSLEALQAQA